MTKDLALLVGPDQKWLTTDRLPRQGRREPQEGDGARGRSSPQFRRLPRDVPRLQRGAFMRWFVRLLRGSLSSSLAVAVVVFVLNTNLLAPAPAASALIIAHRGLGQTFHREGLDRRDLHRGAHLPARASLPREHHRRLRRRLRRRRRHRRVRRPPDHRRHFVVFHDWTLDCRTDGTGVTREHSLAELKALDIGYGYTADGGKTFPFRGKGVGLMPTLDEVLAAFPDRRFLINIKSDDPDEGRRLPRASRPLPAAQRALIWVYGGGKAIDAFAAAAAGREGARHRRGEALPGPLRTPRLARHRAGRMPRHAVHAAVELAPLRLGLPQPARRPASRPRHDASSCSVPTTAAAFPAASTTWRSSPPCPPASTAWSGPTAST